MKSQKKKKKITIKDIIRLTVLLVAFSVLLYPTFSSYLNEKNTPFAINTHRLLVRGERMPYEEATKQEPDTNIKPELSFTAKVLIVTIIVIFIGLMIAVIYSIRDRKRRKARCERR